MQAYNPGTREAKPGGFEVWGQLQLHGETCLKVNSQINKTTWATQLLERSPSMQKVFDTTWHITVTPFQEVWDAFDLVSMIN